MEENKKNKTKKIAIISLLILGVVLILSGYFIYQMTYTDNNGEDLIDEDEENLLYKLDVYKNENKILCKEYDKDYCKDIAFSIPTKTENTKVLAFDRDYLFVLYEDNNKLKIYNKSLNESQGILLENNYKSYELYTSNDKSSVVGIFYRTDLNYDSPAGYFNVETGKKLYEDKYETLSMDYDGQFLEGCKNNTIYFLNANLEKEELEYKLSESHNCNGYRSEGFKLKKYNNKMFYLVVSEFDTNIIYSNSKEVIYDKKIKEGLVSFNNEYVYFVEDNKVKKYDMDGKLVSTSKTYNNIKLLLNNYIIYVNNNNLVLDNLDSEETKVIDKWNENNSIATWGLPGYYTREKLDSIGESAKPEGLYIVVYYKEQDKNGNYGIEYCYTTDKEIKIFDIKNPEGGRAKPVLYLYPTKKLDVKVEFQHPEYLTTTYPKYKNSWNVTAYPNGDLYDNNNKYYYALYWDEVRYNEVNFNEGFYVEKENAINFLEEKLSIIGLNNKERNEFIMYWLPILEQNEKSLVYFEQTKERELGNKLIITPSPDSLLRISIHIKKVNEKNNIKMQKLDTFNRYGFTVVEWGGMLY